MRPGDRVTFHVLSSHTCGGQSCSCTCDLHLPATVVDVLEDEDDSAKARVEFPGNDNLADLAPDDAELVKGAPARAPVALVLDVEFPDELLARDDSGKPLRLEALDHRGKPYATTVTVHGYVGRQGHAVEATTKPPQSGTWTHGLPAVLPVARVHAIGDGFTDDTAAVHAAIADAVDAEPVGE